MIHAEASFGTHPTVSLGCGTLCTFNYDTLISTGIAVLATLGIAFWIRSRLRTYEQAYMAIKPLIR